MDEDMSPSSFAKSLLNQGDWVAGGIWTVLGVVWMFW